MENKNDVLLYGENVLGTESTELGNVLVTYKDGSKKVFFKESTFEITNYDSVITREEFVTANLTSSSQINNIVGNINSDLTSLSNKFLAPIATSLSALERILLKRTIDLGNGSSTVVGFIEPEQYENVKNEIINEHLSEKAKKDEEIFQGVIEQHCEVARRTVAGEGSELELEKAVEFLKYYYFDVFKDNDKYVKAIDDIIDMSAYKDEGNEDDTKITE